MRIQREETIPGKEQTIGIDIELDGSFHNTEILNGKIQLSYANKDTQEFYPAGSWTSLVVDIGDNFRSYKNVIITDANMGNSRIDIYTRTSDDGVSFNGYVILEDDGSIKSEKKRYIQIKVDFIAGAEVVQTELLPSSEMFNGEWAESGETSISLKKSRDFNMVKDELWSDVGELYSKKILREDWLKIDKMNTEVK